MADHHRLSSPSAGILLAFLIPRVPKFSINQDTPLSAATGDFNSSIPTKFSTFPANFSFPAFAELEVDTGSNFIPLKFNDLHAQIFDLQTSVQVGTGDVPGLIFPAKKFTTFQLPLNFSYVADNSSDITCGSFPVTFTLLSAADIDPSILLGANWYNACRNRGQFANGERPGMFFCHPSTCNIVADRLSYPP